MLGSFETGNKKTGEGGATPAEMDWDKLRRCCIRSNQTLAAPAPIGNYFALHDPTTSKVAGILSQWLAKEGPRVRSSLVLHCCARFGKTREQCAMDTAGGDLTNSYIALDSSFVECFPRLL